MKRWGCDGGDGQRAAGRVDEGEGAWKGGKEGRKEGKGSGSLSALVFDFGALGFGALQWVASIRFFCFER